MIKNPKSISKHLTTVATQAFIFGAVAIPLLVVVGKYLFEFEV